MERESARRARFPGDTSANNRDLGYIYDAIGNRLATGNIYSISAGVEQITNPVAYTPNGHNQYSVAAGVTLPSTPAPAPYDLDGKVSEYLAANGETAPISNMILSGIRSSTPMRTISLPIVFQRSHWTQPQAFTTMHTAVTVR